MENEMNVNVTSVTKRLEYQVSFYQIPEVHLFFELDDITRVRGLFTVVRDSHADAQLPLILNGADQTLLEIKVNTQLLDASQYERSHDTLMIFNVPEFAQIEILVEIEPKKNTALSGLYQSRDIFCTQCEAEGFRRILFFLDRPDILSRYTTTIIADQKKYPVLLSNGNCIADKALPDGKRSVTWQDPFPKPSYLFALVAGKLSPVQSQFKTASGKTVDLFVYVEPGRTGQAAYALSALKHAMNWDEIHYGREYDLSAYYIVAIDDFNMGAMENKGLNIFNSKYILVSPELATDLDYQNVLRVVAHEYFHNWTGNRVTCRDWFQLSLKEGFTIFREQSFMQDMLSQAVMRREEAIYLREHQFKEDASPLAHPVRPDEYLEINNFYTVTIYEKGAEIWRMIYHTLGPVLFRQATDTYFKKYDGKAVTIDDLLTVFQETARTQSPALAEQVALFSNWFSQSGTPEITLYDEYHAATQQYQLHIEQHNPATADQPQKIPLAIPIRMGLMNQSGNPMPFPSGRLEETLLLTEKNKVFTFSNISERPIPSLFRDFSAPVKWHFDYSDEDYLCLAVHDSNAFNRQEANYQYLTRYLLKKIRDPKLSHLLHPTWVDGMVQSFVNVSDPWCVVDNLSLPSLAYLGEQLPRIEVDAMWDAREACMTELAFSHALHQTMLAYYHSTHATFLQDSFKDRGMRALKNVCLNFLMYQDKKTAEIMAFEQFNVALQANMTDVLASLRLLVHHDSRFADVALEEFYKLYAQHPLLIDKWFAIQASAPIFGTPKRVMELSQHEAFDWHNPNKIYSLLGGFIQNFKQFHDQQGEGYALLGDAIVKLNQSNPQVASRLVDALTLWRRYDDKRSHLQHNILRHLLAQSLSKDVYEKVQKSI